MHRYAVVAPLYRFERHWTKLFLDDRGGTLSLGGRASEHLSVSDDNGIHTDQSVLLTVAQAAKRLNLSRTFTYALVMSGELESLKLGQGTARAGRGARRLRRGEARERG